MYIRYKYKTKTKTMEEYKLPKKFKWELAHEPITPQPTVTPSALTKTDDTNVTLTLGGSPSTALLAATSLTLGWTGTLADSRIASAAAWNAKQAALSGTGLVKSTAGVISYDTNTYLTTASAASTYVPIKYKVYTAILNQVGTAAPVAIVLENTLGFPITFSRSGVGEYFIAATPPSAFTTNKTFVMLGGSIAFDVMAGSSAYVYSGGIRIQSAVWDFYPSTPTDGYIVDTPIEIRVYN